MGDEWLNHRMICYIEPGVFASIPNYDILQHFQKMMSRLKMSPKPPSTTHYNGMLHSDYKCMFSN